MSSNDLERQVDQHVGRMIRRRRLELGVSQQQLGNQLGISFQQVQKIEKGINRVGSGRLIVLSRILQVSLSYFYEGMGQSQAPEYSRLTLELARNLSLLTRPQQEAVVRLVKSLVEDQPKRRAVG